MKYSFPVVTGFIHMFHVAALLLLLGRGQEVQIISTTIDVCSLVNISLFIYEKIPT